MASGATDQETKLGHFQQQPSHPVFKPFLLLSRGYWQDEGAIKAWTLTAVVLVFLFMQIAVQLAMNTWNRLFFDALEMKQVAGVLAAISWLPVLIIISAITVSSLLVAKMLLQTRWRAWLTDKLAGWWVADQRYYRLGFVAPDQSAPEYRIAEDVRLAIEPLVEFSLGLLTAFITAATFATVLWQVVGSYKLSLAGTQFEVPAYMAWAAVIYAIVASAAALFVGRPLVAKVSDKNEAEAQYRAEMTRLRENAESIALIRGDVDELGSLRASYKTVLDSWLSVIRRQGIIALVLNTNGALFPIVPLLLVTPKYLSGDLTLGGVMQVVAAFGAVQGALIWFVDNLVRLAEWYASASRVIELTNALVEIDTATGTPGTETIEITESEDESIHIENLSVGNLEGKVFINDASVSIAPGSKILISGESGTGKTTLIRAIAGLWPWGSGSIRIPRDASISFMPQKPYIPLGTLRDAMLYPTNGMEIPDEVIKSALVRCGLKYMIPRLDDENMRWDQILSGGERQRVAFCRLLILKPQIIIMDESTSALDEASQTSLLSLIQEELEYATVISIGHRSGMEKFHEIGLTLERRDTGAEMSSHKLSKSFWERLVKPILMEKSQATRL